MHRAENVMSGVAAPPSGVIAAAAHGACLTLPNTADPPPEVFEILGQHGMSEDDVLSMGWYAHPKIGAARKGTSFSALTKGAGVVDAFAVVEPLLDKKVLEGTLRTMDVLNGCLHQCDTCCVDAPLPTKMFSYESLERLFGDRRFLRMLQPSSLRLGSVGDILNHPQGLEIIELALRLHRWPDEKMTFDGLHRVKVFTNYRPHHETQLDRLIELASANPERLRVTISLPLNRSDAINWAFEEYVRRRPQYFDIASLKTWKDGMLFFFSLNPGPVENVSVQDVRHPRALFLQGRRLSDEAMASTLEIAGCIIRPEERSAKPLNRGFVKTFLNPDGLWLKVYATIFESHTMSAFTRLTAQTLSTLQYLQYHPDFGRPPQWPGGAYATRGVKLRASKRPAKDVVFVK
jgi:hypothetical protein